MFKYFFLILVFSTILLANGNPTAVDKEIMALSLNYEFDEADRLLAEQFTKESSLKNHFLYLNVELIKVIKATDEVPFREKKDLKIKMNNKLLEYAENVIEDYEDEELSIYDQFYLGSIHGVLGRLHGVARSWMSAFSSGKEGRNIMEDVLEEDSTFTDAYLLIGMLNYYSDRMGGFTEFIAGILGLSGDRNIGIQYLEKVEKEGVINNWQATMMLIELYSRLEGNKFAALPLLEKIVARFPQNKHFTNWLCYEYINMNLHLKAEKIIENDSDKKVNDFVKAIYYHDIGEYKKSNELYKTLLSEKGLTWPWVYENAKYTQVLNSFYLDDSSQVNKKSSELIDRYSERINLIKDSPKQAKFIKEFKTAIILDDSSMIDNLINNIPEFTESKKMESQFYYYQGILNFKENNLTDAEKYFLLAKEINPDDLGVPSSQYLIHLYKINTVEEDKVERLLDDIDNYDNDGLEFFAQDLEEKYNL